MHVAATYTHICHVMCVCVCWGRGRWETRVNVRVQRPGSMRLWKEYTIIKNDINIKRSTDLGAHLLESNMRQILLLDLGNLKDFFHRNLGDDLFRHARPRPRHTRPHTQARVRVRARTHTRQPAAQPGRTVSQRAQIPNTRSMWPSTHPVDRCTCLYVSRYKHIDAFHMFICIYMFICRAPTPSIDAHMYTYVCIT